MVTVCVCCCKVSHFSGHSVWRRHAVLRGGSACMARWTCDLQVASLILGRSANGQNQRSLRHVCFHEFVRRRHRGAKSAASDRILLIDWNEMIDLKFCLLLPVRTLWRRFTLALTVAARSPLGYYSITHATSMPGRWYVVSCYDHNILLRCSAHRQVWDSSIFTHLFGLFPWFFAMRFRFVRPSTNPT